MLCIVISLGMFLFGNAYSGHIEPPLIVLLFFLPTVFHCSGIFGSAFFSGPVVHIFCKRWFRVRSPSCLSSFWRLLEIFGLVRGQVQKGCFLLRRLFRRQH